MRQAFLQSSPSNQILKLSAQLQDIEDQLADANIPYTRSSIRYDGYNHPLYIVNDQDLNDTLVTLRAAI